MLNLYRRHFSQCKHAKKGQAATNCGCPIWAYGYHEERRVRRSLKTTDWNEATRIVKEAALAQQPAEDVPTVEQACRAFIHDCETRNLAAATVRSYEAVFNTFIAYCKTRVQKVSALRMSDIEGWRQQRKTAASSQVKELVNMKTLCQFIVDRGWLKENPAAKLKPPKVTPNPTLPYTREEVSRILAACETDYDTALVLTLLYSGMRISDTILLARSAVESDGRLRLRIMKTGAPLYVKLPPACCEALDRLITEARYFYFMDDTRLLSSEIDRARKRLAILGAMAGVPDVRPHRFRDTFAVELLLAGEDIRTVQLLLGHESVTTTEKHYAPFVQAMQAKLDAATAKLQFS